MRLELSFTKMEGIGNDYIYVDGINQDVPMNPEFIKKISDRHFGIGSDGMIVILPSDKYDFKMRMFNLDGSEGMMCGNGIRCFAKFCYDHHLTEKTYLQIETKSGLRTVELIFEDNQVVGAKVDMQEPITTCKEIPVLFNQDKMINQPVDIQGKTYHLTAISMGNPHVITYVDDLTHLPLEKVGPVFEHHPMFPESVNTEFVEVVNDHYLKMRVWERGSGETMACGTGACAVMYASYLNGYCQSKATVELLGGCLEIEYRDGHIFMSGPATTVFEGKIKI
ncbi:diaminopimelate epimerase [Coprobacillus sp. AF33-1AC]|uniref:diaminopimelate epimerase n=1 Tax=Coprobacillus sp. AF33-1AC TaxID=2292032 RepID=UPI000E5075A2|nr:diaminopimelate epimerase [Coprobacillus sp. AF33-1AC]